MYPKCPRACDILSADEEKGICIKIKRIREIVMNRKQYIKILENFIPSREMREYLKDKDLDERQIESIILGSPVPLRKKAEFATGGVLLAINKALDELELENGEIFYLKEAWFDEHNNRPEYYGNAPFLSLEKAMEKIADNEGEYDCQWFILEKWINEENELLHKYTYYIWNGNIVSFEYGNDFSFKDSRFVRIKDLNLPVPFKPGDIVNIDCSPFAPPKQVIITEIGDNKDCCCLQALYRFANDRWGIGALKHYSTLFAGWYPPMSTLYRMAKYEGNLSRDEEKVFRKAKKYLNDSDRQGRKLYRKFEEHVEKTHHPLYIPEKDLIEILESEMNYE